MRRGYSLPLVLMVLMILSLGLGLVFVFLNSSISEGKRVGGQLRAFYACDSAIRLSSRVAQNVVLANPQMSSDELTTLALDAVCRTAGSCIGARRDSVNENNVTECRACEYAAADAGEAVGPDALMPPTANMESFRLRVFPRVSSRPIQFGAFRDLNALQSLVAIQVQGVDQPTGTVAHARESFSVATISPFQLMAFSTGPMLWQPLQPRPPPSSSPLMARLGPSVYAGGELRIDGTRGGGIALMRAVSVGPFSANAARIWDGNVGTPSYNALTVPDDRRAFRIRTPLKLTAHAGRTPGQLPAEASTSTHWLIEPPGPADNEAAVAAKLASQADIRILDGVWFLKPPPGSAEPDWPGIPIWSDRPGRNVLPSTLEERSIMGPDRSDPTSNLPLIGQGDIVDRHGLTSMPRRFSYYETDPISGALMEDPFPTVPLTSTREGQGVVSYGLLATVADPAPVAGVRATLSTPGFYTGIVTSNGSGGEVCQGGPVGTFLRFSDGTSCRPGDAATHRVALLDGARGGFRDVSAASATGPAMTPNVLPLNFDVSAFVLAMRDNRRGELGSYFCADPTQACRRFNGIIYIAATWPGSLGGLINPGVPTLAPPQRRSNAPPAAATLQPRGTFNWVNNGLARTWLPRQLCSSSALQGTRREGVANNGAQALFPNIACDESGSSAFRAAYIDGGGPRAGVTALRITNAQDLRPFLEDVRLGDLGFTIASNLPTYILGNFNAAAGAVVPGTVCPPTGALPAGCSHPLTLVAGDRLTFLSGPINAASCFNGGNPGFNDRCSRWDDSPSTRNALGSVFSGAFMSGATPSTQFDNIENNFRVLEHWASKQGGPGLAFQVRGAMFTIGRSMYQPEPMRGIQVPQLDWGYLSGLGGFEQPPGAPRFEVGVTSRWRDLR
jgi:hypothetical protein